MYLCSNHLLSQPERIEFYSHISNKAARPVGFAVKGVLVFFIIKETTASDKEGGSYPWLPGCERTLAWVSFLILDPWLDQCFFFFCWKKNSKLSLQVGPKLSLHPRLHRWDWISGSPASPPLSARGLQMQVCFDGRCYSLRHSAAVPSVLTDRRSCLFHFVKCPWVKINWIYCCYYVCSLTLHIKK